MEQPETNENMRHIPTLDTMRRKIDGDLRANVEAAWQAGFGSNLDVDIQARQPVEQCLKKVCHWLEKFSEALRRSRGSGHHEPLRVRLDQAFAAALQAISNANPQTFRHRAPYHQFDRSRGECVVGALLAALRSGETAVEKALPLDSDIYMKILSPAEPSFPQLSQVADREAVLTAT